MGALPLGKSPLGPPAPIVCHLPVSRRVTVQIVMHTSFGALDEVQMSIAALERVLLSS